MSRSKLTLVGNLAITGLFKRIEKLKTDSWDDQWCNWDDLGGGDEWGDISDGPDQPGPDDR